MQRKNYKHILKMSTVILGLSVGMNIILACMMIHLRHTQDRLVQDEVEKVAEVSVQKEADLRAQIASEYEKEIKAIFTPEELNYAMQRQWHYRISVNGKALKTKQRKVDAGNIRIMVAEVMNSKSIFSTDMLAMGSIEASTSGSSLTDLIEVYSVVPYTIEKEVSKEGIKYYYTFQNVPKETMIILMLSPLLTEKLEYKEQLKDNQIALITQ